MNIEPSRTYRTRNGQIAFIYSINNGGNYPIRGRVSVNTVSSQNACWMKNGSFDEFDESELDIVSSTEPIAPNLEDEKEIDHKKRNTLYLQINALEKLNRKEHIKHLRLQRDEFVVLSARCHYREQIEELRMQMHELDD